MTWNVIQDTYNILMCELQLVPLHGDPWDSYLPLGGLVAKADWPLLFVYL